MLKTFTVCPIWGLEIQVSLCKLTLNDSNSSSGYKEIFLVYIKSWYYCKYRKWVPKSMNNMYMANNVHNLQMFLKQTNKNWFKEYLLFSGCGFKKKINR